MLQLALLLLGCTISQYLLTISCTITEVAITTALFGAVACLCFTIAATLFYNCPYRTPGSLIMRSLTSTYYSEPILPSIPLAVTPGHPVKRLKQFPRSLLLGMRNAARGTVGVQPETPHVPLAAVTLPFRVFRTRHWTGQVLKQTPIPSRGCYVLPPKMI